jgi:hypothetical protein
VLAAVIALCSACTVYAADAAPVTQTEPAAITASAPQVSPAPQTPTTPALQAVPALQTPGVTAPATSAESTDKTAEWTPARGYYKIDEHNYAYYEKPKLFSFVTNVPFTIYDWLKDSFQAKNAPTIAGIAVATGALIAVDQELYRDARRTGRALGISGDSAMGRAFGTPIQYPVDLGTALYFIGDGMIPISITLGMFTYGMSTSDIRSLQTSSQLAEGLLSVAVVTQAIKRSTGRKSPGDAPAGDDSWKLFPSFSEYGGNTPHYDAMPSGHVATGVMTITILADNYPEYTMIRPIGYTLMGLLGFQMMNNGVHWASDYPLAIAIGYGIGKTITTRSRKIVSTEKPAEKTTKAPLFSDVALMPAPAENGGLLLLTGKF